jgi:drug/metabolite transporter (DMT)-like permease
VSRTQTLLVRATRSLVLRIAFALIAFAGNSLLCRWALKTTAIDPASFTTVRMLAGAVFLWCLLGYRQRLRGKPTTSAGHGSWLSAMALWGYAAAFSFAYVGLTAATGALVLFGAVQTSMTLYGLAKGERLSARQWLGMALALGGLVFLLLPNVSAPPLAHALLMVVAGVAWAMYSLRGKSATDPLLATAGNFRLAVVPAVLLSLATLPMLSWDLRGALVACVSGALASGAGYAVWYAVLPRITPTQAATLQLSVPVIAAMGGLLLGESVTLRLVLCSAVVLGGVGLVTVRLARPAPQASQ